MTADQGSDTSKRSRSPAFPYISLQTALERIQVMNTKAKRNEVRVADIAKDWGFKPKSSSLDRNVAALLAYGLIEDAGSGDARKIKLSENGYRILEDKRPGVREKLLSDAALKPKIIADYAQTWSEGRPDDTHSLSHLMFDGGFTDEGARIFLRVFDETLRFASIPNADKMAATEASEAEEDDDTVETDSAQVSASSSGRQQSATPAAPPVPTGSRKAVFTLDEGDVSLIFPADLSADGYQELKEYLDIFLRKAQRQKAEEAKKSEPS